MSAERLLAAGFSRMAWMDEMVVKSQNQSTRPPRNTLENRASALQQRPLLMMKQMTMKQPSKKQLKVAPPPPAPAVAPAAAVIEAKIEEVSGWIKSFFSSGSQPVVSGATSAAGAALAPSAGKGQRGDSESGAPIDPALSEPTFIRNKTAKWQKATNAPLGPLALWTLREHFKFGGGKRVIDFFRSMDADGSGEVTIKEFGPFVKFVGFTEATDAEIADTFKALDVDGSGRIPYVELDKKLREKPPKREPIPKPPLPPEVLIKKEIVHGAWPAPPPPPPAHTTWRPREYDSRYLATTQEDPRYTLGRERPSWGLHVPSRHVHKAYSDDEPFVMADGTSVATGELDERLLKQSQLVVQRPRGGGDSTYAEEVAAAKIAERNPTSSSPGQPRPADPTQPGLGRWAERLMSERVGWVPEPLNGTPIDVPHSFKAAAAEEVLLRVKELKARQTRLEAKRRANEARKGRARTASPQTTLAPTPTAAPAPPPGAGGIQISSTLRSWVPDPLVVPSPFHAVAIDMLPAPTDGVSPPDAPKTPKAGAKAAGAASTLRADGKMDLPAPPDLRPDLRHRTNSPSSARSAQASSARGPAAFHAAPVFQGPLGHPRGSPSGATPRSPSPRASARAGSTRSKSDSGPSPRSSRGSKTSARDSKGVDKAAFRASLGFS